MVFGGEYDYKYLVVNSFGVGYWGSVTKDSWRIFEDSYYISGVHLSFFSFPKACAGKQSLVANRSWQS